MVLWGAYVRASGSGAGCGSHWPLCNGEVVPRAPRIATIIEFTHRVSSGIAGIAIAALFVWCLFLFPRGHRVRKTATFAVAFLIVEILLGAGLVLLRYVEANASIGRAIYLSLHLINTQFLLAMLALTAWYSRDSAPLAGRRSPSLAATLPIALLVSVTGAITALGDTLFPATSLSEGMRQDLSTTAHFLLRLRIFHPALAILAATFFAVTAIRILRSNPGHRVQQLAFAVLLLTGAQLGAGAMNLALLAPIWMQLFHLLLANLVWMSLVLLTVEPPNSKLWRTHSCVPRSQSCER